VISSACDKRAQFHGVSWLRRGLVQNLEAGSIGIALHVLPENMLKVVVGRDRGSTAEPALILSRFRYPTLCSF
jgi:hypothetical protein